MKGIMAVFLLGALLYGAYDEYAHQTEPVNVKITVQEEECIYNAVGKAMKRVDDRRDIQEVVYNTMHANGITDTQMKNIKPGTTIIVPCERRITE